MAVAATTDRHRVSLRRNFSWSLAGNVVGSVCTAALMVVLSKLASPGAVGQYVIACAIINPAITLANLNLRATQVTDVKGEYRLGHYLALRLVTTTLFMLAILVLSIPSLHTRGLKYVALVLAVAFAKGLDAVSDVFWGVMQQHQCLKSVSISIMLRSTLSLIALALGLRLSGLVLFGVVGVLLVDVGVLLAFDIPRAASFLRCSPPSFANTQRGPAEIRPLYERRRLLSLAHLSLPLGVVLGLIAFTSNIPRYALQRYHGESQVGFFGAMTTLVMAGSAIVTALGQAALPRLARHYADGQPRLFISLLGKLCAIGGSLGAGGIAVAVCFGGTILRLAFRPEYGAHRDAFVWMMVAAGLLYNATLLGYAMMAVRRFVQQLPLFILVALATTATAAVAVPPLGLRGAALTMLTGGVVQIAGSLAILWQALRRMAKAA